MNPANTIKRGAAALVAVAGLLCGVASADTYDLTWNTVDGGGGMNSVGGTYTLSGTIGQPDAGVMTGGTYTLTGGFWAGASPSAPCYGDLNNDRIVDLADLVLLLSHYGDTGAPPEHGDLNGDGIIDLSDLVGELSAYGDTCP